MKGVKGNIFSKVRTAIKERIRTVRINAVRLSVNNLRRFGFKYFKNMSELVDADKLEKHAKEYYSSDLLEINWDIDKGGKVKGKVNISKFYEPEWNVTATDKDGKVKVKLKGIYPHIEIDFSKDNFFKEMELAKKVLAMLPPLYVVYIVRPVAIKYAPESKKKKLEVKGSANIHA